MRKGLHENNPLKMSIKSKGINAERELVHMFWANGWACLRIAGSGSSRYPSPDILTGNKLSRMAIECKVTKETAKYFGKMEIKALLKFADVFGAQPWIAIKFREHPWIFVSLEDLNETDKGYSLNADTARTKGLLFEEIIKK
jgi:holliday junction resolvase Hjr